MHHSKLNMSRIREL